MSTWQHDAIARIREALAQDGRTNTLDVDVRISNDALILHGILDSDALRADVEKVATAVAPPSLRIVNRTRTIDYSISPRSAPNGPLRVAAVGDLHVGRDCAERTRERFAEIAHHADVLLLAGDLTQHGLVEEALALADAMRELPVPVAAVLGNHDYHGDRDREIAHVLEEVGVRVLQGTNISLRLRGRTIGIAGSKGFGTGFAGATGSEFGEPEMKAFVRYAKDQARALEVALSLLRTDVRIALMHYSPVPDTLEGERREIYPFLGSYLLAEAIDAAGCDLALHGHAHRGKEMGVTPGGVPVRNVAQHVIGEAYRVYSVGKGADVVMQPMLAS
jgi:Icc-related predicted phosphoesterase